LIDLERVLVASRAYEDDAARILELARTVPKGDAVRRMFIHLDRRSPPLGFRRFGPRLVPVFNYFQAALVLYEDKVLSARQVIFVALEMLDSGSTSSATSRPAWQDIIRRGRVARDTAMQLIAEANEAAKSGALSGRTESATVRAHRRGLPIPRARARTIEPRVGAPGAPRLRATRDEEHDLRRVRRKHGHG